MNESLIKALILAQGEFPSVKKESTNPHFKSKYADLDTICATVNPILRVHGLIVVQTAEDDSLRTTLYHVSGESVSGIQKLHPAKDDPQGWHGAQTYARRYALLGILGLAAEDDDGNAGSEKPEIISPPDKIFEEPLSDDFRLPDGAKLGDIKTREELLEIYQHCRTAQLKKALKVYGKKRFAPPATPAEVDAAAARRGQEVADAH